jgi:hypothetical protein
MGDPARKPVVPMTVQESAKWAAKCSGCETVHFRLRKPKAAVWSCKCPRRCELTWQFIGECHACPPCNLPDYEPTATASERIGVEWTEARTPMKNSIFVIKPYKWEGMWVFDDAAVGLFGRVRLGRRQRWIP